jgi:hypothetical protein
VLTDFESLTPSGIPCILWLVANYLQLSGHGVAALFQGYPEFIFFESCIDFITQPVCPWGNIEGS